MEILKFTKLCLCIAFLCFGAIAHALITPGQIIFKTDQPISVRDGKTGLVAFDSFLSQKGLKSIQAIKSMHQNQYYLANLSSMPEEQQLSGLSFPGIAYIQPNYLRKMHLAPNDQYYNQLVHYVSRIPVAWNYSTGSHLIKVGIVDSGVLINHPDLHANIFINQNEIPDNGIDDDGNGYIDDWCGWDFADAPELADTALGDYIDQDNNVEDENFHGTHVAGIVGAVGNNSIGVVGVCWNVGIVPIRAGFRTVSGSGYLQDDDAAAAIIYATDMGCNVINMSWGDPNYSAIIADACEYAYNKGVTLIASAGNDAGPGISYPAKLTSVISVGSVNKGKQLSGFSSYGTDLDLVAVGERVLSTYKLTGSEQYFMQDGTSMSAPYVTGAVALLLSLQPDLNPAEVRSRLLNSCEDIGDVGFDIKTGHGLLNVKNLLDNINPPYVEITSPLDQLGISATTPIIGSVYGDDFARYTVCYKSLSDPNGGSWKDVTTHYPDPELHTQQVHNGVLAEFYIPSYFPEGTYLIRLQYEKCFNNINRYNYYRTIIVDRSAPVLDSQRLSGFKRYEKQNLRYYAAAVFDEVVRSELHITASDGSAYQVYSSLQDSVQTWKLPASIPEGPISISISACNSANIWSHSQVFSNFMNIVYESVPGYGFQSEFIGAPRRPLHKKFDFNGNGEAEYIAMEMPSSGYGTVKAFEPHSGAHVQTHSFDDAFWPLDFGNTNQSGVELLLLKGEDAFLWETGTADFYPNPTLNFQLDTGISGGVMADYDNDGILEFLTVKNKPAEKVIQAYKRNASGSIVERNTISNPTTTFERNNFVPTIIVDNLDGDNMRDILCADTDGDVMVFEIINANLHEMRWHTRLPVGNAYTLTTGDFNGDGAKEFFVGGWATSVLNQDLNFWYFEGFKKLANDQYTSMGSIMFNDVQSQNSITSADLDNDGKDELILAIAPNLYVLNYINGKFVPTFNGESFRNYQVSTWCDVDGITRIMANMRVEADSTVAVQWSPQIPFTGPSTPANLRVKPLNENSIRISWVNSGAPEYSIFRKNQEGEITLLETGSSVSYTDTGLSSGQNYSYAVVAIDPSYSPSTSNLSTWVSAIPLPKPKVIDSQIVGSRELRLFFNQAMPTGFTNPGCYKLSNGMGNPLSANSISNQYGVQLRFRDTFPAIDSLFVIELRNLTGISGVEIEDSLFSFPYEFDTVAPEIVEVTVLPSQQSASIKFSEELSPGPAVFLPNYRLVCPQNDADNYVISASLNIDTVTIDFAHKLKHSNYAYLLETSNLTDLAGNVVSPQYNLARFGIQAISNLKNLTVFPNPVTSKHAPAATFVNFPIDKKGRITIYNSGGNLVYQQSIGPFILQSNNITWTWDLKNNDGRPVSSGIYFYVVEMNDEIKRGKLAIIR